MKISIRKYAAALAEALLYEKDGENVNVKAENFLLILRKNKKTKLLKRFMQVFSEIWNEKKGIMEVNITTPYKYDEKETAALRETLSKIFKREIRVHEKVDKDVIGGFKMEFSDYVIDGTVKKNLEILKSNLSNT